MYISCIFFTLACTLSWFTKRGGKTKKLKKQKKELPLFDVEACFVVSGIFPQASEESAFESLASRKAAKSF